MSMLEYNLHVGTCWHSFSVQTPGKFFHIFHCSEAETAIAERIETLIC